MKEKSNRREFVKKTGILAAAMTVASGCANAQNSASAADESQKAKALARRKAAVEMSPEEVKIKRRKESPTHRKQEYAKMYEASAKGNGKWEIIMLGTCCGSEPMPKNNHTSFILRKPDGEIFWFDAGEYCSWTAHNMGIDVLRCKNIFLSHPHMDHIGGLPGLVTTMLKMRWLNNPKKPEPLNLTVHTGVPHPVDSVHMMITRNRKVGGLKTHLIDENGEVYKDENATVEAIANNHMPVDGNGRKQSYSYRIKLPHKTVIFTGDIKNVDDIGFFLRDGGCDILMIETGHHKAEDICERIKEDYPDTVKEIFFMHHGTPIIADPEFEQARAEAKWGKPVVFTFDRQIIDIS